ncbi:MAG: hypothetical protein U0264_06305 [Candidatus Kapaibacterium sp.]
MKIRTWLLILLVTAGSMMHMRAGEIWERTGTFDGEKSGAVISLGLASNGNVFACVNTGAPTYRSTDHGVTWKKSSLPSDTYINAFAVRDSTILAASLKGVYLSTNHGSTWKLSNTGLTTLIVKSLKFSTNGMLYAGTHGGGVFRSSDRGRTWQAANTGLSMLRITALILLDSTTLIAATDGEGIFVSTNGGDSWKSISADVRLNTVRSFAVNSAGVVFAGTDQYGIFRSATRGDTWDYLTSDIASSVNALLCTGSDVYAATGFDGVFRSSNNGDTWTQENTGIEGNAAYSLETNALGQVLVGTNGGAVYRRVTVNGVDEDAAAAARASIERVSCSNNELRVTFTAPLAERVTLAVYSLLGQRIAAFDVQAANLGRQEYTAVGQWPRGMYLCRLESSRYLCTELFHIQ